MDRPSYLEPHQVLRPRECDCDVEENVPYLINREDFQVLECRPGIAQLNHEELGVVQVPARGWVELRAIRVLPLHLLVERLMRLQQGRGGLALDSVLLLVDDKPRDVRQELRDLQLPGQVVFAMGLLVDEPGLLLRFCLRLDW